MSWKCLGLRRWRKGKAQVDTKHFLGFESFVSVGISLGFVRRLFITSSSPIVLNAEMQTSAQSHHAISSSVYPPPWVIHVRYISLFSVSFRISSRLAC